jgi:hypothetical protein
MQSATVQSIPTGVAARMTLVTQEGVPSGCGASDVRVVKRQDPKACVRPCRAGSLEHPERIKRKLGADRDMTLPTKTPIDMQMGASCPHGRLPAAAPATDPQRATIDDAAEFDVHGPGHGGGRAGRGSGGGG